VIDLGFLNIDLHNFGQSSIYIFITQPFDSGWNVSSENFFEKKRTRPRFDSDQEEWP
jgi:hypothetical protein